MIGLMGAAVDYSRASDNRAKLQAAIDGATLAGAEDGSAQWQVVAGDTFKALYKPRGEAVPTPQFTSSSNQYAGTAATSTTTSLLTPFGYKAIEISAAAKALTNPGQSETSCILTLGQGQALAAETMTFSGSPNVSLAGCNLRSNESMKCNGHDTGALASMSAGTTTNCSNPASGAPVVPDIDKPLAANITRKCSTSPGASWSPGSPPPPGKMFTVNAPNWTEYHVCGDLTLTGSGSITGASPYTDTIIVIENGSLNVAANASISAQRTAFVLTGNNTVASGVKFPNGAGQGAKLSVSPPTDTADPWAGIAIYQDPALTYRVDSGWGPGATIVADGVIYLPNANLNLGGNAGSSANGCTKIVANTVVIAGAVDLRQSLQTCSALQVHQWATPKSVILIQ
jgi:hypothetical protein